MNGFAPRAAWFGLMAIGGLAFGLNADRRPFGDDVLAHPLTIFFILVGIALLALRVILRRPVPEILPERVLIVGCLVGLASFLAGNWLDAHVLPHAGNSADARINGPSRLISQNR